MLMDGNDPTAVPLRFETVFKNGIVQEIATVGAFVDKGNGIVGLVKSGQGQIDPYSVNLNFDVSDPNAVHMTGTVTVGNQTANVDKVLTKVVNKSAYDFSDIAGMKNGTLQGSPAGTDSFGGSITYTSLGLVTGMLQNLTTLQERRVYGKTVVPRPSNAPVRAYFDLIDGNQQSVKFIGDYAPATKVFDMQAYVSAGESWSGTMQLRSVHRDAKAQAVFSLGLFFWQCVAFLSFFPSLGWSRYRAAGAMEARIRRLPSRPEWRRI